MITPSRGLLVVSGSAVPFGLRTYKEMHNMDDGEEEAAAKKKKKTNDDDVGNSNHQGKISSSISDAPTVSWKDLPDEFLLLDVLPYLDTVTLIQKKRVCKIWNQYCTETIDNKCITKKPFQSKEELQHVVDIYSLDSYINRGNTYCTPNDTEEIACSYGYPINKWDVSDVTDFSDIFFYKFHFNEPIGSWDVSNATSMCGMFCDAREFNQDISTWNVSKVTNMKSMFSYALSFNQDISSWNVSNVTTMSFMFNFARDFNGNISSWDVSNVTRMVYMFDGTRSFNQDLSSWDVSDSTVVYGMFDRAKLFKNGKRRSCLFGWRLPWYKSEMKNL